MMNGNLQQNIDYVVQNIGAKSPVVVKNFFIGRNPELEAAAIFISGFIDKNSLDRDVLTPLMLYEDKTLLNQENLADYLIKAYIPSCNTSLETDLAQASIQAKQGSTVILIKNIPQYIVVDTSGGEFRPIEDPANEFSIRGIKEGFIENIDTNVSLIRRKIKDNNLAVEKFILGKRGQSNVVFLYIDDIVDHHVLQRLKERITAVNVDHLQGAGVLEQLIEDNTYSIFPRMYSTERVDKVTSKLLEGRIAIFVDGASVCLTAPTTVWEFFHTSEDYFERVITANFMRMLRFLSVVVLLLLPATYLTLIKFNIELIPVDFVVPIASNRTGMPLTPFMEILILELFIELLREGGLRLPSKIAQTLSIVGGIIIGDAAVNSRMVSPTTLLIVGITVVASFLIPNYEMSLALRILRFVFLLFANAMGIFGLSVCFFFLLTHVCALESFGSPYMSFYQKDIKDMILRAPMWQMNERPESIPNNNPVRQENFRDNFRRKKDGSKE